jgi:hypothetical protein
MRREISPIAIGFFSFVVATLLQFTVFQEPLNPEQPFTRGTITLER